MGKKHDCRPNFQRSNSQLGYLYEEQPATHCASCGEKLPFFRDPNVSLCADGCKSIKSKEKNKYLVFNSSTLVDKLDK